MGSLEEKEINDFLSAWLATSPKLPPEGGRSRAHLYGCMYVCALYCAHTHSTGGKEAFVKLGHVSDQLSSANTNK